MKRQFQDLKNPVFRNTGNDEPKDPETKTEKPTTVIKPVPETEKNPKKTTKGSF